MLVGVTRLQDRLMPALRSLLDTCCLALLGVMVVAAAAW